MKSYALALFLILLLFVVGCGKETTEQTPTEESSSQTVDDITNVETVDEDLSVNEEEDDYGDII